MGRVKFKRKEILMKLTDIFSDVSNNVFVTNRPALPRDQWRQ